MSDYELALADRAYSSWSLRGWLAFDAFGVPVRTRAARLYTPEFEGLLRDFAPARSVPALRLPDGLVIADSLAIAEEIAARHPEAGHWPADPRARAVARSLMAQMHSGFGALRSHCPMNLRRAVVDCAPPPEVRADLERLGTLWAWARRESGSQGPWLCGDYSLADVVFAPVACRIAGYNLPVAAIDADYVAAHLAHPSFRRWRAMALCDGADQPFYARPQWDERPWPGPAVIAAKAVASGPARNDACPYSGRPVTDFARIGQGIYGFCNAFCRDKTVADPAAWPKFMEIFEG